MRPTCSRCGASNRHIDESVTQLWQCSACGRKNQHDAPEPVECVACIAVEDDECACDPADEDCVCDAPDEPPEYLGNRPKEEE